MFFFLLQVKNTGFTSCSCEVQIDFWRTCFSFLIDRFSVFPGSAAEVPTNVCYMNPSSRGKRRNVRSSGELPAPRCVTRPHPPQSCKTGMCESNWKSLCQVNPVDSARPVGPTAASRRLLRTSGDRRSTQTQPHSAKGTRGTGTNSLTYSFTLSVCQWKVFQRLQEKDFFCLISTNIRCFLQFEELESEEIPVPLADYFSC